MWNDCCSSCYCCSCCCWESVVILLLSSWSFNAMKDLLPQYLFFDKIRSNRCVVHPLVSRSGGRSFGRWERRRRRKRRGSTSYPSNNIYYRHWHIQYQSLFRQEHRTISYADNIIIIIYNYTCVLVCACVYVCMCVWVCVCVWMCECVCVFVGV